LFSSFFSVKSRKKGGSDTSHFLPPALTIARQFHSDVGSSFSAPHDQAQLCELQITCAYCVPSPLPQLLPWCPPPTCLGQKALCRSFL
jgi:hypothetical protein